MASSTYQGLGLSGKYRSSNFTPKNVAATACTPTYTPRDTTHYPSRVTPGGDTTVRPNNNYTGSALLGIGTMHKSNAVPVFSKEDAVAIREMKAGG
jgi:hypothetical protein